MNISRQGGYEEGYRSSSCFWGTKPGSLVKRLQQSLSRLSGLKVLDLGCGEGKNAAFLAQEGCFVDAVDCSSRAIANGQSTFASTNIKWFVSDALEFLTARSQFDSKYDIVISYGLLHCLEGEQEIDRLIGLMQCCLEVNGSMVICCFNNRSHDFSAHPDFAPTLLSHESYLAKLRNLEMIFASDEDLYESHPHNNIYHHHSMTRCIVEKRR